MSIFEVSWSRDYPLDLKSLVFPVLHMQEEEESSLGPRPGAMGDMVDTFLGNLESRSLARATKKRKKYAKEQEVQEDPEEQEVQEDPEEQEVQEDPEEQEEQKEQEEQGQDLTGRLGARNKNSSGLSRPELADKVR